jgi:hypothetical protein
VLDPRIAYWPTEYMAMNTAKPSQVRDNAVALNPPRTLSVNDAVDLLATTGAACRKCRTAHVPDCGGLLILTR